MHTLRIALSLIVIGALGIAGTLYAQPDGDDKKADVTVPMGKTVNLSPKEMSDESNRLITAMQSVLRHVIGLQQKARKQKDVIKLNCVNDKLLQVKQLLNIAESARTNLVEAVANNNTGDQHHQFGQIRISHEKVRVLSSEAEACIGEELNFLGPTKIEVDRPAIVDDPTKENPFDVINDGPDIERPAFASPFI